MKLSLVQLLNICLRKLSQRLQELSQQLFPDTVSRSLVTNPQLLPVGDLYYQSHPI